MPLLFLAGDVMTGRGIDQVLPHPGAPRLYEACVQSALDYVRLAELESGPIAAPVGFDYVWGDALEVLEAKRPDARIVNLETAVTARGAPWPDKGIHYRMHPANVAALAAARIDACALANNHVLDWGREGLAETLAVLVRSGIATAGAGENAERAAAPAVIPIAEGRRVLVFAYGEGSSGVPRDWAATNERSGVNRLADLSPRTVEQVARAIGRHRRAGDLVVASIHWGGNWGYAIGRDERAFAHALIDTAHVDVVHGHSSHHPKGIELHAGRPILYGCGDLLNDYEGISGYREFAPELRAMYFPTFGANGALESFDIVPMRLARFRLERAGAADARALASTLARESARLGTRVEPGPDGELRVDIMERAA
ncbi:MAG TPA: CapA family protein [Usitatibacter sp.]|nr:CapA family protein [Usitatibacter sp.]